MPAYGKLTPAQWGRFMPVHQPASQNGPWYYRNTESVIIEFLTDAAAAAAVLPSDLELVEPATAFMIVETNHWSTLGRYSEVYNGILCKWRGELHAFCSGVYVTSQNSLIVGREVLGFGKKLAHHIEIVHHDDGQMEALVNVKPGDRAVRALVTAAVNEPAAALALVPLLCLRVIPDPEGSNRPSLAQLVSVLFDVKPIIGSDGKAEFWSGPGSLTYGAESDAQLPVSSILSCKYVRINGDLPYGKVLKTYTDAELPK